MATKKKHKSVQPEVKLTKRETFGLNLTKFELLHLRDLFSCMLAPAVEVTVSQALARKQERPLIEAKLWHKLIKMCESADIPVGDGAPDFIVAAASSPIIDVFELACEPAPRQEEDESAENNVFESPEDE